MTIRPVLSLAIATFVSVCAPWGVPAVAAPAIATADRTFVADVDRSLAFLAARSEALWPGFRLQAIPFVLHRPGGPAFLFQHPAPFPPGFVPAPGHPRVGLQAQASGFPHGIHTDYALGDRRAVTVTIEPGVPPQQTLITAVHEAFHQFQHGHRFARPGSSADVGMQSARDMALAELEQSALGDALVAPAHQAKDFARMFLAVRETRHAALPEPVGQNEETLETLEGTANYVEQRARIVSAGSGLIFARPQAAVWRDLAQDLKHPLTERTFARARYYRTGAAIAFLLDRWSPTWKCKVEQGATPQALLAQAVDYTGSQRATWVNSAERRYDMAAALRRHQGLFGQVKQRQAALLAAFERQSGRRVEVQIAFEHGGISQSAEGQSFSLAGDRVFSERAIVSLESPQGTRVLLQGAILGGHVVEGDSGHYSYTLYLPVNTHQVLLDGAPLPTAPGRYTGTLRWESDRAVVISPRAVVEVTPTMLRVRV